MMKSMWDESIRSFLQRAGSGSPTPGGGSVAAIVGALGASMTSMVANLSQGEKFASVRPQIEETIRRMADLTAQLEELLQADIESFNAYMAALKLPKSTDEQKLLRRNALQAAAIGAIDVPLRLIEACRDGLTDTLSIAECSNANVISDLAIGAVLLEAAAQSAALTIEINLASLKDSELKGRYSEQLATLMGEMEELKRQTLHLSRMRMG